MLQKEFFLTESFNPNPYWDNTIVNLTGSQKFDSNAVFKRGIYKIELAPGRDSTDVDEAIKTDFLGKIVNMVYTEYITEEFFVRAYCGSNAENVSNPGQNVYSGPFKINARDGAVSRESPSSIVPPIDSNHIFGAGGANTRKELSPAVGNIYVGGGANCLGNGNFIINGQIPHLTSGAGSCLHLIPVGGTFGTNYIRAYHAAPTGGAGSAMGGGGIACLYTGSSGWFSRGGNSPYGNGATGAPGVGTGIGKGGTRSGFSSHLGYESLCGAGAYFNGTNWVDVPGQITMYSNGTYAPSSYIKITYLGPLQ